MWIKTGLAIIATAILAVACSSGASSPAPSNPPSSIAAPPSLVNASPVATPKSTPPPSAAPTAGPTQLQSLTTTNPGLESKLMESGFGSVWAISLDGLEKISDTGDVSHVATIKALDVAVGKSSLFVLEQGATNELDEVSPTTGKTLRNWQVSDSAHSVALSDTDAYVIHSTYPATVDRIELSSGALKTFTINELADGVIKGEALAFGAGQLWTSSDGTTIYGLDPTTLTVKTTAHVPTTANSVWFGNDAVWASADGYHAGIHRIDPATGTDTADLLNDAIQLGFSPSGVWLSAADGPTVIDPTSTKVTGALAPADIASNFAAGVAILNDKAFISYFDTGELQLIQVP